MGLGRLTTPEGAIVAIPNAVDNAISEPATKFGEISPVISDALISEAFKSDIFPTPALSSSLFTSTEKIPAWAAPILIIPQASMSLSSP